MEPIRIIAIVCGSICAAVEFYVTTIGNKSSLHRKAHLLSGLAYMGLVYVVWMIK